ncbi:MAG: ABC transporter substrate-binding protein [Bryobacteraceae bacterium]|nr:ABC transporter substrate-binding protein [Bryobacteraceae bacterium]
MIRIAIATAVCLILSGCASPDRPASSHVRIAVGGQSQLVYLPATLAAQLGHYRDEGLDVALTDFPGGAKALEALWGGSADVVCGFYEHTIQMAAEGRPLKAFVIMQRLPGLALAVSPATARSIASIADLRGATVGVSSPGSSTSLFLRFLLKRNQVAWDDVAEVGVGMSAGAVAAMERGKVDAAVMADPALAVLEKRAGNVRILADTRTVTGAETAFGTGSYPAASLYTTPAWLDKSPGTAEKLARAIRRTLIWMRQHPPEEIAAAMPPEFAGEDTALYTESIRRAMPMYSPDGQMPSGGPQAVTAVLGDVLEKVKGAKFDPAATYVELNR